MNTLNDFFYSLKKIIKDRLGISQLPIQINNEIEKLHDLWKNRKKNDIRKEYTGTLSDYNQQEINLIGGTTIRFTYDNDIIRKIINDKKYKVQKKSLRDLMDNILSENYLNSDWIYEIASYLQPNWVHDDDNIILIYFVPMDFYFIQDGKHRFAEALSKQDLSKELNVYIVSSDDCLRAMPYSDDVLLYGILCKIQNMLTSLGLQ